MTIGERIKEVRTKLGISQVSFADKIGVSKQTLYKYENDIITNIPSDKIEAIAEIGGTSPAYLMGWEESVSYEELDIFEELMALIGWEYITLSKCDGLAINEYLEDADKVQCNGNTSVSVCYLCEQYRPYYYLTNGKSYFKLSKEEFDNLSSCLKPYLEIRINEITSKKSALTEFEYKKKEHMIAPSIDSNNISQLNAAHADDYENAPEELKKLEEDIMDDENF